MSPALLYWTGGSSTQPMKGAWLPGSVQLTAGFAYYWGLRGASFSSYSPSFLSFLASSTGPNFGDLGLPPQSPGAQLRLPLPSPHSTA